VPEISRRTASVLGLAALILPRFALAQDTYPSRPIHVVVGFPPGAAADISGRVFAEGAGPLLGQQIVVENKPGAGSSIAAAYVARAAKDGYTVFLATVSIITNQLINPNKNIDVMKDFAPVALLDAGPIILVVNPASEVHSVAELIMLAKSNPGKVLDAAVSGSLGHFSAELFAQRAGITLTEIPYPGSPQAVMDVIAGRAMMTFSPSSTVVGQVAAGKLRALATAANKRADALPDVPSMAEAGMSDFDTSLWFGLFAPAGTPRPVIDKIADAAHKAMSALKALDTLRKQGYEPLNGGPDEFGAFIRSETARWSEVAHKAGLLKN
jgi:tripartite-type tricarboxylate transporter receptor subunit TctC